MSKDYTDLALVSKSSARVATFLVKVWNGAMLTYTYKSKRDGREQTVKRWECTLLGLTPGAYCAGFLKGNDEQLKRGAEKFPDGSMWLLSKAVLDPKADLAYISTPLKFRVDLDKSALTPAQEPLPPDFPSHPVPPRTVAETATITSTRATDLIALVKEISKTRTTKSGTCVATVTLIDGSKRDGVLSEATIDVSVFGDQKIFFLEKCQSDSEPVVFFNLQVKADKTKCEINHWSESIVTKAPASKRAGELKTMPESLRTTAVTDTITSAACVYTPRDISGFQPLSVCAYLDYTSGIPSLDMPEVVQICWARLQEPCSTDDILDRSTGQRLWFLADLSDVSGGVQVGVPERCALNSAGCLDAEAFTKKHNKDSIAVDQLRDYTY